MFSVGQVEFRVNGDNPLPCDFCEDTLDPYLVYVEVIRLPRRTSPRRRYHPECFTDWGIEEIIFAKVESGVFNG